MQRALFVVLVAAAALLATGLALSHLPLLSAGLAMLVALPVLNVASVAVDEIRLRHARFAGIALIVLALLLWNVYKAAVMAPY